MIQLCKPSTELVTSYIAFMDEMKAMGEKIWDQNIPFLSESLEDFVFRVIKGENQPQEGLVPETIYWAVRDNKVVGRIALRHFLSESLKEFGGHIGYEVRPSDRKKGIAKEMLRQLLQTTKCKDIGSLLLTCAPDNTASIRTIIANGGVLEKTIFVEKWNRDTSYYWITIN